MKKGKRLLVLLAVAVAFGVGAYALNASLKQQEAAKEAAQETPKTVLITVAADSAAKLSYTLNGETIDFTKDNGAWVYAPRAAFALDTTKVDAMLSGLTSVEAVRQVTDSDDSKAEYGLAEPALTVTVTDTAGATQTVALGDKNTTTGDYYAAVAGKPGVYTVAADLYNAFDLRLMELLTAEAFPTIGTDAVTGLDASDGTNRMALEYHESGDASAYSSAFQWFRNQDGVLTPVNPDTVSTYLTAATGVAYAGTAADTKADLASYGLDAPKLTLTLTYTDQVAQSQAAAAMAEEAAALALLPTATPAPSATPAATDTATPTVAPAATDTAAPSPTATATATPTATPTATATAAPTATPTATLSGGLPVALAEGADAVPTAAPTDTPTATPTATPEPMVPITRTITLWFGATDADGNIYMTHSKTDRIFTVSADTFTQLAALATADMKVDRPAYLALGDITGMTATMGGVTKTVAASAVTETAASGEQTVKTVYLMDGKELQPAAFSLLVNSLKALKAEAYADTPVADGAAPTFSATFTQSRTGFESLTVAFYPYDGSFEQAVVNGDATMLVNKRDVAALQSYFDGLVAVEPTATPTAAPTAAPTATPAS